MYQKKFYENGKICAYINLNHIAHNYNYIKNNIGNKIIMSVIKADGYGHGAVEIAKRLMLEGASYFAVSSIDEAMELKNAGITGLILVFGYIHPDAVIYALREDISISIPSIDYLIHIANLVKEHNLTAKIHLKLDTGMNRIGFSVRDNNLSDELLQAAKIIMQEPRLLPEGIFTHFACADKDSNCFTALQYSRFLSASDSLEKLGCNFKYRHTCNSGSILSHPNMRLDMVRLGIHLYGCSSKDKNLLPAMEFKTKIIALHSINENESVGYGQTYHAKGIRTIATVAVGYADGLPRLLSNCGYMLVQGEKAPIAGNVCMDMTMLDVTDIKDVSVGDDVVIIGRQGDNFISADDIAELCSTISYEIICGIGKRVRRIYIP